jgi:hypothetical protein
MKYNKRINPDPKSWRFLSRLSASLGVKMENDKFKAMSDEKLITAANSRLWISGEEGPAAAELYKRQKQREGRNLKIQFCILGATILAIIIAAITLFFVIRQFYQPIYFYQCPDKKVKYSQKTQLNSYQTGQINKVGTTKTTVILNNLIKPIKH